MPARGGRAGDGRAAPVRLRRGPSRPVSEVETSRHELFYRPGLDCSAFSAAPSPSPWAWPTCARPERRLATSSSISPPWCWEPPRGSRSAGARVLPEPGRRVSALSAPLLLTALLGASVDGASRWVYVGPLSLQVSLIVLPVMIVLYARRPDLAGTAGMAVAALALALQPDRAMAGVLAAGLAAVLAAKRGGLPLLAAIASILAFGWTLLDSWTRSRPRPLSIKFYTPPSTSIRSPARRF